MSESFFKVNSNSFYSTNQVQQVKRPDREESSVTDDNGKHQQNEKSNQGTRHGHDGNAHNKGKSKSNEKGPGKYTMKGNNKQGSISNLPPSVEEALGLKSKSRKEEIEMELRNHGIGVLNFFNEAKFEKKRKMPKPFFNVNSNSFYSANQIQQEKKPDREKNSVTDYNGKHQQNEKSNQGARHYVNAHSKGKSKSNEKGPGKYTMKGNNKQGSIYNLPPSVEEALGLKSKSRKEEIEMELRNHGIGGKQLDLLIKDLAEPLDLMKIILRK
ncbi:hypothetical protein AC249_AIPGENE27511 [Exaiptasia diaphana]|nr:hypothetical protein AC249_AIPGENE27511 [Exaiptasia diaphana]